MYIILAILAFGILIATHELGHFMAAKACGVRINEFSIGMGPALFKKQGSETKYSLRLLPIGGFCSMEGEDEESDDPRAFSKQAAWKKLIILIAGATMNFIFGLIIVVIIVFSVNTAFVGNTITDLADGFALEDSINVGDKIYSIDGHRIYYAEDFSTYMSRSNGSSVDMVIIRDGEKVQIDDLPLTLREYEIDGKTQLKYGITFNVIETNFAEKLNYSWYTTINFVRSIFIGLSDLLSGAVNVDEIGGVVYIVDTINDVGQAAEETSTALLNIAYLCAFIAVNLAVMNMLPIPALDGGRVFLLIVTLIIERVFHKKVDPKYEAYIHAIGLILLIALMVFVLFNDIMRIVNG